MFSTVSLFRELVAQVLSLIATIQSLDGYKYLKKVVDDFIKSRTTLEAHAGSSVPCRPHAYQGSKKVAARGSLVVCCAEPMSLRKMLSHLSYPRLPPLIVAGPEMVTTAGNGNTCLGNLMMPTPSGMNVVSLRKSSAGALLLADRLLVAGCPRP